MLVAVLAAGGGLYLALFRPSATPITPRQALHLYASGQSASTAAGLPSPGVYTYQTSGQEGLDLPGESRSFPASTSMVVTGGRCAEVVWAPIVEHIERFTECPLAGGGLSFSSSKSTETIAGITTTATIRCPPSTYLLPPHPKAGARWRTTCTMKGATVTASGELFGLTTVKVGGRKFPAWHSRVVLAFSGGESGTNPSDYWLAPQKATMLKEVESVNISQGAGPLGSVQYQEHMTTTLHSLHPIRSGAAR